MALPEFTLRQLLEAGVHFGHQTHLWNPKMGPYIFGTRNNIHILDLSQTYPMLHRALGAVSDTVANGGRVLLVGTKRQASEPVAEAARRSAQYFVNARWLGGMLTNWNTISNSIRRLRELEALLVNEAQGFTKKERLALSREQEKLETNLGGIKDMGNIPNLIFVIDSNKETIAIQEARKLGIPVAAILDSNSDPDNIDYPIPGNDDAGRSIAFYCDLIARAAIDGLSRFQGSVGLDVGANVDAPAEDLDAVEKSLEEAVVSVEQPEQSAAEQAAPEVKETPAVSDKTPEENKASPKDKPKSTTAKRAKAPAAKKTKAEPVVTDDLKKVAGVGAAMEKKLRAHGVTSLSQIASMNPEQLEALDKELGLGGRPMRDNWVESAKALIE